MPAFVARLRLTPGRLRSGEQNGWGCRGSSGFDTLATETSVTEESRERWTGIGSKGLAHICGYRRPDRSIGRWGPQSQSECASAVVLGRR